MRMSALQTFLRVLKKFSLLILIVSMIITMQCQSINHQHLALRSTHSLLSLAYSIVPDLTRPALSADYRAFETIVWMNPIGDNPTIEPAVIIKNLRSNQAISLVVPKPEQCQITQELFEHDEHIVDTYWIDNYPHEFQKDIDPVLIYFHGGGYIMGDINSHGGIECHFSERFNMTILHVEYRLIPEHPLSSAVDDAIAIYKTLLRRNISPSQIIFMGDSAGGGLALLTIQALLARHIPVPQGIIVLSPWTDLSISSESYIRNEKHDAMLRTEYMKWVTTHVFNSNHSQLNLYDPQVSPLYGSFHGFPPMYINVGTAEILEDDSKELLRKAEQAGVNVTFEEGLHLMHVYPLFFPFYPEARQTLNNIHQWIQNVLD